MSPKYFSSEIHLMSDLNCRGDNEWHDPNTDYIFCFLGKSKNVLVKLKPLSL